MISLKLDEKIDVFPDEIEQRILKLINKKAPICYSKMSNAEINFLNS